jgi:hypothetical protein
VQVAEVFGDRHVAHHRAAEEREAAPVRGGGVDDLLHAVDVAREARDDDATRRLRDHLVEHRADVALERREAGHVGVGRVDEEEVDAVLAEARERAQVGEAPVEGQLVHLEVAGGEHRPGIRVDRDGERIGDRVVDRDELEVERTDLLLLPSSTVSVYALMRCSLSFASTSESELRADERDVLLRRSR